MDRLKSNKSIILFFFILVIIGFLSSPLWAFDRFPRPEFQSDYTLPEPTTPEPRTSIWGYFDIIVLLLALILATYFCLKLRRRGAIFGLMIFSLLYFGFSRRGCVCPIGAIQNITLAIFSPQYSVSLVVLSFFLLPLIFALFFGRTFCAAVCPLGAIQDLVALKPIKVPAWLARGLGMFPVFYLALAVASAATGSDFIICRFDPFVGFFRLSGSLEMLITGIILLVVGIFVARPYCRFICPYGVLLGWMSRLSRWHVTITPDDCIKCRLCEDSCPFDAIQEPTIEQAPEKLPRARKRLVIFLALTPLITLAGGFIGSNLNLVFSHLNQNVRLAEQIRLEEAGVITEQNPDSTSFRETGVPIAELLEDAVGIKHDFWVGGWFWGGFTALIFMLNLIGLSLKRRREFYEPHRANCLSCGRCFDYCPQEQTLRKQRKKTKHV